MMKSSRARRFHNHTVLASYGHQGLDTTDLWVSLDGSDPPPYAIVNMEDLKILAQHTIDARATASFEDRRQRSLLPSTTHAEVLIGSTRSVEKSEWIHETGIDSFGEPFDDEDDESFFSQYPGARVLPQHTQRPSSRHNTSQKSNYFHSVPPPSSSFVGESSQSRNYQGFEASTLDDSIDIEDFVNYDHVYNISLAENVCPHEGSVEGDKEHSIVLGKDKSSDRSSDFETGLPTPPPPPPPSLHIEHIAINSNEISTISCNNNKDDERRERDGMVYLRRKERAGSRARSHLGSIS